MIANKGIARGAATIAVVALLAAMMATAAGAVGSASPRTIGGSKPERPVVSGTRVVWSDFRLGRSELWVYDNATKKSRQLTTIAGDKVQPVISGDNIAFVSFGRTTGADVYVYNLTSGTVRALTQAAGDQTNPTISGRWVAWEDFGGGYMSKIVGYDLLTNAVVNVDTGSSLTQGKFPMKRRPQAAGDIVVYESALYGQQSNVMAYDFTTGIQSVVASTSADERMPATDGTWVAWMQSSGTDGYNVMAKNLQTGDAVVVAAGPGEQSVPSVGNGVAYWVDMARGGAFRAMNLATGALGDFPYRTRAAMAGVSANGDALAWLQQSQGKWKVTALFGAPVPGVSIASILPQGPAWTAFRFALLPANGDTTAPVIESASVDPGQLNVVADEPLKVFFSESMDPATINAHTVGLVNSKTRKPVASQVRYSPLSQAAVITPDEPLASGSYTLVVDRAVMDTAGNAAPSGTAVAFSTSSVSALGITGPNMTSAPVVRVVSSDASVAISWTPAVDDVGVTGYYVKRSATATPPTPGTLEADFAAATTLTPIGAGSSFIASPSVAATFNPVAAGEEKAKKSTFYYYVYAVDTEGFTSWADGVSGNNKIATAPDPHGGANVSSNTCLRCHGSIHGGLGTAQTYNLGALGARGAKGCYVCHGSTSHTTGYGYNSVNNIQAQFWDYTSNPMPTTGSRHGNAYIRAQDDNQQCDMCHAPHKRPYRAEAANSFGSLLQRTTNAADASSAVLYSTDAAPFNQSLCFNCHGSGAVETGSAPYAYMYVVGGTTAFDNSAGDHDEAQWTAAAQAHGTANVTDTARALPNSGTKPSNPCQVCHNEHGSEAIALLDYRRSGVTTGLADSGALCLKCHGAGPEAGSPNNWTTTATIGVGVRNIATEFARTGSTHPISVAPPTLQTVTWSQTSDSDFSADAFASTEITGTGSAASVVLTRTVTPPATGVTQDRVPTSDISRVGWTVNGGGTTNLWAAVDEYPTPTDTNYVVGINNNDEVRFGMTAFTVPPNATNITVNAYSRMAAATAATSVYNVTWRTGGTWRSLPSHSRNLTSFNTFPPDAIAEPGDGTWTAAEVNSIDGMGLIVTDAAPDAWVSQLYFLVTYDTPASTTFATSGSATSAVIASPGTLNSWGAFDAHGSVPASTTMQFSVLNGATDAVIYSNITLAQMPYSLGSINVATVPTLKVRASMTGSGTATPALDDWSVSYTYTPAPSGTATCYSCHNTHYVDEGTANTAWQVARSSSPTNTKNTPASTTAFCIGCHVSTSSGYYNSANGSINITATVNQSTLIPYTVVMRAVTSWPFFNGWDKGDFTNSAHYSATVANGKALCENCHDPHGSNFDNLTAWTRPSGATITGSVSGTRNNTSTAVVKEENLCFQCHGDGTTAGKGKAAGAPNIYTPMAAGYAHPTISTSDVHDNEEAVSNLTNRHSECADCHDAHEARPGVHTQGQSVAGGAVRGVTGVKPTWAATVWTAPTSYALEKIDGGAADYEAYVCFKCHSDYTTLPSTGGSGGFGGTNLAREFNPSNQSGHNVLGLDTTWPNTTTNRGTTPYTPMAYNGGYVTTWGTWTNSSKMTCSDCHTYNTTGARGPHGSNQPFMVRGGNGQPWWQQVTDATGFANTMCSGCHTWTGEKHTRGGGAGDHGGLQCQGCHIRIPHGSARPRFLRRVQGGTLSGIPADTLPYADPTYASSGGAVSGIQGTNYGGAALPKSSCGDGANGTAGCTADHPNTFTTYWP